MELNVLYEKNWTEMATVKLKDFQTQLIKKVKEGYDGKEEEGRNQWSFSGAFLYSLTVITTIGYGNIAPRTPPGKVVTMLYAIIGIPLMLLYLTNIGDFLANSFKFVYQKLYMRLCRKRRPRFPVRRHHVAAQKINTIGDNDEKAEEETIKIETVTENHINDVRARRDSYDDDDEEHEIRVPISLCMLLLVGYIGAGAMIFSLWEQWNLLDGSYFCFVTLSTIGFGDLVPGDNVIHETGSEEKLALCSLYLLVGMALLAMCFNLVQEEVINKVRNLAIKLGIITADPAPRREENHQNPESPVEGEKYVYTENNCAVVTA